MLPRIEQIVIARHWLQCLIRIIGIAMIAWGVVGVASVIIAVCLAMFTQINVSLVEWLVNQFDQFLLIGLGLILMRVSRRLAAIMVPMPARKCPHCDYSLVGVRGGTCPECGMPIPIEGPSPTQSAAEVP